MSDTTTDQTTTTTKPPAKAKAPAAPTMRSKLDALADDQGIAVRYLRFHRATGIDIPGKPSANAINTLDTSGERYDVTYVPTLRTFRCVHIPRNRDAKSTTFYIHETWCTWEPLEQ